MMKEKSAICPECGKKIQKYDRICKHCGSWFKELTKEEYYSIQLVKCKKCGAIVKNKNANFCQECGVKLQKEDIKPNELKKIHITSEKEAWPKRIAISLVI
ncbi:MULTISPECIES: zinc ribbon domain-containing protein [Methanobacterium]|nr:MULTISPECIES: zinc ribbon domain-containing protein [Methanobacterium]